MKLCHLILFFKIFVVIFVILLIIFDSAFFTSILPYQLKKIALAFKTELTRPPQPFPGNTSLTSVSLPVTTTLPPLPPEAQENNLLELPQFGIKAPIWTVTTPDEKLIYQKLRQGVVLYPGSAAPGQGYTIILGHSSQYPWQPGRYKSVFSLLSQLQKGDLIYVYWEGKPLIFQVEEQKIFLPWPQGSETTETIFPPEEKPILILQSCWPVGVAYKRVAVKAVLLNF